MTPLFVAPFNLLHLLAEVQLLESRNDGGAAGLRRQPPPEGATGKDE